MSEELKSNLAPAKIDWDDWTKRAWKEQWVIFTMRTLPIAHKRGYSGPGHVGEFVVVLLLWSLGAPSILIYTTILNRCAKNPETFVNKWTDGCKLTCSLLDTYIWHILKKTLFEDFYVILCMTLCWNCVKYKKRSHLHMLHVQNICVYKIFVCTKHSTWYFKNLFLLIFDFSKNLWIKPNKKRCSKVLQDPPSKESILVSTDKQI